MRHTYARSIDEAFGPYASQLAPLVKTQDPMPLADKLVISASIAGLLAAAVLAFFGAI